MRLCHHDLRDMKLAFSLAFDLRRVLYCGLALCWTIAVAVILLGTLSLGEGQGLFSAEGVHAALYTLFEAQWPAYAWLIAAGVVVIWWLGFGWLTGPVLRSAAMDIARDEREHNAGVPLLNRQVALAPLIAALMPALAVIAALLWSLTTWIPGTAGAIIAALLLIPAMAIVLLGAVSAIVAVLAAPMFGPTAVIEGRDLLEAVSRPVSYVFQASGRYALCLLAKLFALLASALFGAVALALAWLIVLAAVHFAGPDGLAQAFLERALTAGGEGAMASLLASLFWASVGLYLAWLMAVSLCADVLVYLLMRYRVDGVTFDVITIAEERLAMLPTATATADQAEEARKRHDAQAAEAQP